MEMDALGIRTQLYIILVDFCVGVVADRFYTRRSPRRAFSKLQIEILPHCQLITIDYHSDIQFRKCNMGHLEILVFLWALLLNRRCWNLSSPKIYNKKKKTWYVIVNLGCIDLRYSYIVAMRLTRTLTLPLSLIQISGVIYWSLKYTSKDVPPNQIMRRVSGIFFNL